VQNVHVLLLGFMHKPTKDSIGPLCTSLTPLDVLSCIIAAAIHDYKHTGTVGRTAKSHTHAREPRWLCRSFLPSFAHPPFAGVVALLHSCVCFSLLFFRVCVCLQTNIFHQNTVSDLAIRYNDVSILENYHVAEAFDLMLRHKECDILATLSREQRRECRETIIQMVLATDMKNHISMLTDLQATIEQKKTNGTWFDVSSRTDRMLLLKNSLHLADVSNPTKPTVRVHAQQQPKHRLHFLFASSCDSSPCMCLCCFVLLSLSPAHLRSLGGQHRDGVVQPGRHGAIAEARHLAHDGPHARIGREVADRFHRLLHQGTRRHVDSSHAAGDRHARIP